ncbi:MAG: DNA repair protein RadC [Limisphaera sp.]|nr:DNA repair protein RadC [Limisphaera sp.]
MASGHLRLKDQPPAERPRERLVHRGAEALTSAELLAILLRTGHRNANAVDLGHELLRRFGSLHALAQATVEELQAVKGVGRDKAVTVAAAFALARRLVEERIDDSGPLRDPEAVARLVREEARLCTVETFWVVLLNTRHRLIKVEKISQGTLDTILVHPREVFRLAIVANAAALVLVHNHPSGDPTPSESDVRVTRDLVRAGQLLRIELLDHVIVGRASEIRSRDFVSLRELGLMYV